MDIIYLLEKLIEFKTTEKNISNEALEFCKEYLENNNIKTSILEKDNFKSLVAEIGSGDKTLIFNGHLDVVPGDERLFIPFQKDGKVYGRGAADMKAGVAAMLQAFIELKDKDLKCKLQLQLVTDEEIGGENCSSYLVEQNYLGDFVICGEPTNLGIAPQAKGVLQFDVEVFGKSVHGSRPWEGDNALLKAYDFFEKITKLPFALEKCDLYDCPSINLAKIIGGDAYNKVPDYCKMSIDIRFLPTQNYEDILSQIEEVTGGNIKLRMYADPVKTSLTDKYVTLLSEITEKYTNSPTRIFGQHGSADTRFYSKFNIPAIEFGPAGANWHGNEEYVEISSLNSYKEILKDFALNFR